MDKTVLIVDDEKNIRLTLSRALKLDEWDVSVAVSGEEALNILEQQPDKNVVLLDMKLPGMDGLEVLRRIRQKWAKPVVIMITAYGTVSSAVEAMKLGAVDFLSKPFNPNQMRELLNVVVQRADLKPEDAVGLQSCIQLAKRQIIDQKFREALESVKKAISFDPRNAEAVNLHGAVLELLGRIDEARKEYRTATTFDPTYEPARSNLERVSQFHYQRSGLKLSEDSIIEESVGDED